MTANSMLTRAAQLATTLKELLSEAETTTLSRRQRRGLIASIEDVRGQLEALTRKLDLVELPDAFFDPSEPLLIGRFVSLALVAQDRRSLASILPFYGSGIYAIYYVGDAEVYKPISGTETPAYVGKADPIGSPKNVVDQGTKLFDRLKEHRRTITAVEGIEISDFEYRALAVQSGYQSSAEDHLKKLFAPIWNSETKILYGIGKHGDAATTRGNTKSPFDTLHPGRAWAASSPEIKTQSQIRGEVEQHFRSTTIYRDTAQVSATALALCGEA
jgi:hypothetical protein